MRLIKRLDLFILKNFLTLFAGTFCISLFVVMMQFLWKYIDDLIGKGLTFDIYVKFFFYAIETLVPTALPLAVLLASLISFGNIGERLELLAIKAAGISLIRALRPLIVLVSMFSLISFHFQNKIAPEAWHNLLQMIQSMKMKSPELDIPEGVFYDGIENVNLYVERKDKQTGMLYDVIIYNMQDGASRAHIILADSGKLETTFDKMHLLLHLYEGEQFENLTGGNALQTQNVPYRRETFVEKHFIIDFDTNFKLEDQENSAGNARTKTMAQLTHDIDSMETYYDSLSVAFCAEMERNSLSVPHEARISDYDSLTVANMDKGLRRQLNASEQEYLVAKKERGMKTIHSSVNVDSLMEQIGSVQKQSVLMGALQKVGMQEMEMSYKAEVMEYGDKQIRLHWIQFWQKITMALSCLMFFFIGAPLGAIIRKGGLGFPVVVAVIIFIIYYIIDTGSMKVSREGGMPVWLGMWISTLVLAPLGVFFTVKSNNDSAVFNMDVYVNLWKKLLGIRPKRNITRKEVIINDPDYTEMHQMLGELITTSREYLGSLRRSTLFGYLKYIALWLFTKRRDGQADQVQEMTEYVVEVLSNSKDRQVLKWLNGYPVLEPHNFRFYRRRRKDLRAVVKYSEKIDNHIINNILGNV